MTASSINFVIGGVNELKTHKMSKIFSVLLNTNESIAVIGDKNRFFKNNDSTKIEDLKTATLNSFDVIAKKHKKTNVSHFGVFIKKVNHKTFSKLNSLNPNAKAIIFIDDKAPDNYFRKAHDARKIMAAAKNTSPSNVLFISRAFLKKKGNDGINTITSFLGLPQVDLVSNKKAAKLFKKLRQTKVGHNLKLPKNKNNNKTHANTVKSKKLFKFFKNQSKFIKKLNSTFDLRGKSGLTISTNDVISKQTELSNTISQRLEKQKALKIAKREQASLSK